MSFNDKLDKFFTDYVLEFKNKPTKNKLYIYADYVELIALFSNDTLVGPAYFLDRLEEKFPLDKRFFRDEILEYNDEESIDEEENQSDKDEARSELNDLKQRFSESIFTLLNERKSLFKEDYPFNCTLNSIQTREELNVRQKTYLILLLCSSLDIFKVFNHELTKEFEKISFYVLKGFLPQYARVKSFGKNSDYTDTYAVDRIKKLALDLKVETNPEAISQISPLNTQEKGLDLIGWVPFEDSVPNLLCIIAQCACQKEFIGKLAESSRYERYLNFHVLKPNRSLFIPYSLIESSSSKYFIRNDEISIDTLLFERKRILNYLDSESGLESMDSFTLLDRCLSHTESLV